MSLIRCKMCGGTIEPEAGATVGVCDSCGTRQTLPAVRDEALASLFNRANTLRIKCDFDKAGETYGKILSESPDDAEAHWGAVLCKYGIEYVEDPKTFRRIPTCHRTSFEAIEADADYRAALEKGDTDQKAIYEAEAREIDRIQKDILNIVRNEKPFDVFICYKETDENGKRTVDSAIANDIYHELTEAGYKVFYAAITLEDKLGEAYEPYIFAALTSSKVMLAVATKPEYYSAVWVKNEWSRFLSLMKSDRHKLLIPCYRDMETYELPGEFSHLQAQNMDDVGFINDIVRGIGKLFSGDGKQSSSKAQPAVYDASVPGPAQLMRRVDIFLEDGNWVKADEYCERVLNLDATCADAYLCKLFAEMHVRSLDELRRCNCSFEDSANYAMVLRFADGETADKVKECLKYVIAHREEPELLGKYNAAVKRMEKAATERSYTTAALTFEEIKKFRDSEKLAAECRAKAEICRKDTIYREALELLNNEYATAYECDYVISRLKTVGNWKDSDRLMTKLTQKKNTLTLETEETENRNEIIKVISAIAIGLALIVLMIATSGK